MIRKHDRPQFSLRLDLLLCLLGQQSVRPRPIVLCWTHIELNPISAWSLNQKECLSELRQAWIVRRRKGMGESDVVAQVVWGVAVGEDGGNGGRSVGAAVGAALGGDVDTSGGAGVSGSEWGKGGSAMLVSRQGGYAPGVANEVVCATWEEIRKGGGREGEALGTLRWDLGSVLLGFWGS